MLRPRSVTITAWLQILYGVVIIATATIGLVSLAEGDLLGGLLIERVLDLVGFGLALLIGRLVLGVFMLIAGLGLLRLKSWAWLMAMIIQGLLLALLLLEYWNGTPLYAELLVSATLVFLLNQREVQRAVSVAQHRSEPTSLRTAQENAVATREAQANLARRDS